MTTCEECLDLVDLDEAAQCEVCHITFCPDCSGDYTTSPTCKGCWECIDRVQPLNVLDPLR